MYDQNLLKMLQVISKDKPNKEQRARTWAAILASPIKSVEGKMVYSRENYQESYDTYVQIFLTGKGDD